MNSKLGLDWIFDHDHAGVLQNVCKDIILNQYTHGVFIIIFCSGPV